MLSWTPPLLGFGVRPRIVWKDRTTVAGGILGDMSTESLARMRAEEAREQELRAQGVVILKDFR